MIIASTLIQAAQQNASFWPVALTCCGFPSLWAATVWGAYWVGKNGYRVRIERGDNREVRAE